MPVTLDELKDALKKIIQNRPGPAADLQGVNAAASANAVWAEADRILNNLAAGSAVVGCCHYTIDGKEFKLNKVTEAECNSIPADEHKFHPGPCT